MPQVSALWALASAVFGLVPSLAFFIWIERNCSLPMAMMRERFFDPGWPWIDLAEASTPMRVAWNAALVLGFGLIHSTLAQRRPQAWIAQRVGVGNTRAAYLVATGLSVIGVMGFWQSTGVILWVAPLSWERLTLLSIGIFWSFALAAFWSLARFGWREFVGLRAEARSGALVTDGLHGVVRHPAYLLTMLAFVVTPFMSLDRLVFALSVLAYLLVAIPVEERKLLARFGTEYEAYRDRVPALFPRFRGRGQSAG